MMLFYTMFPWRMLGGDWLCLSITTCYMSRQGICISGMVGIRCWHYATCRACPGFISNWRLQVISATNISARDISAQRFHHRNISACGDFVSTDISARRLFGTWTFLHKDFLEQAPLHVAKISQCRNIHVLKCPIAIMSMCRNVFMPKCPWRQNVHGTEKSPYWNVFCQNVRAKMSFAEMSGAEINPSQIELPKVSKLIFLSIASNSSFLSKNKFFLYLCAFCFSIICQKSILWSLKD